ncbi:hypothetical protein FRC14_006315 [Serendipita sp. 396]|nr:hypothetical protein FRC14_006315 [Serendipita sp. 396]KAG8777277.1 hypothetical protein FRC15_011435 [Serendipita sp. 397]KAG8793408.1 hypothetical protein FRC16_010960 [Serendipita sp. 398]KAG8845500.1 hypothetical protein FRB91_001707 [Serendipita sp. 411]KAG9020461.1 hypothetical protein FS842_007307 [Serendipita sp. 407]
MSLRLKSPTSALPPFSFSPPSSPSSSTADAKSPQASLLPVSEMHVYGLQPLESEFGNVSCNHCHKPFLKSAILNHTANCEKIRNGGAVKVLPSLSQSSVLSANGVSASSAAFEDPKKSAKKRKASEMEGGDGVVVGAKKRAKPAPRVTKGRQKGPVDVDRQCGVINDKGLPCSRSLTCKSHAMGAKRAVEGRSKAYDELLLEWNRAHKPNFVEPVKRPTKEEKKQQKDKEKAEKAAIKQAEKQSAIAAALAAGDKPKKSGGSKKKTKAETTVEAPIEEEVIVDPMEQQTEVDRLISAVRTLRQNGYGAMPLAVPADARLFFLKRRELVASSRELLTQALQSW